VRVIEELSIADASTRWCAMIGVDGGYMTAYIDQAIAREMYPDIDSVTAITFAPPGKAVKTKNGFIAKGRWPFGSGCQHATWLIGHFVVFDGDAPCLLPNGLPETRFGLVPKEEAEILDTWTSNGLRGSGSHDWMVKDRFIPEERTFDLAAPINYRGRTALHPSQPADLQSMRGATGNRPRRHRRVRRAGFEQARDLQVSERDQSNAARRSFRSVSSGSS
jgi:hypothetical protein